MSGKILFSTNCSWRGKPEQRHDGVYFDNHKISPGWHWWNVEDTIENIFKILSVDGMPIAPALLDPDEPGRGLNRRASKFKSTQLILIDVDSGMTIEDLIEHKWYKKYSCGFYTTHSHTESLHKFRVLFQLQTPMTDCDAVKDLYNVLIRIFGGDPACKDGCRLFYGSINAAKSELRENVILPDNVVRGLIAKQNSKTSIKQVTEINKVYNPPSERVKRNIVKLLATTYSGGVGGYNIWFKIGCAMKRERFDLEDFVFVSSTMMESKDREKCRKVWDDIDISREGPDIGMLINYLKEKLGQQIIKEIYA